MRRKHKLHFFFFLAMLMVAITGTVLGAWAALTSLGRYFHHKSSCLYYTLPQLSLFLIPLHHVPVFVLTTLHDHTFFGRLSAAGAFNICTSMAVLVNAFATTKYAKCGGCRRVGCYDDNTVELDATSNYEEMV